MPSASAKDTVTDRDMIDLQCLILKAKVQRILGIVENVNPATLEECLAGVIVPVEVDFNGTQGKGVQSNLCKKVPGKKVSGNKNFGTKVRIFSSPWKKCHWK